MSKIAKVKQGWGKLLAEKPKYGQSSRWFIGGPMQLYARHNARYINGQIHWGAILANIIVEEKYQQKGLFTEILEFTEEVVKKDPLLDFVCIENPNNPVLWNFLERRGYKRMETAGTIKGFENYFKLFITAPTRQPELAASDY